MITLYKTLPHTHRMLSYIKYAVNLTKYSLLRSTSLCSKDGTFLRVGNCNVLLLPTRSSDVAELLSTANVCEVLQPKMQRISSAITLHSRSTYTHQLLGCDCHPTAASKRNWNSHLKYSIYPDMKQARPMLNKKAAEKQKQKITHNETERERQKLQLFDQ